MKRFIRHVQNLGACGLLVTATACAPDLEEQPAADAEQAAPTATPAPEAASGLVTAPATDRTSKAIGTMLDDKVAAALADLAEREGISPDDISLTSATLVTWGSSAVGCPKEGMNYTQAVVPGVLVLLETGGTTYRYHGSQGSELFYCPDDRAEAPAYGAGEQFM